MHRFTSHVFTLAFEQQTWLDSELRPTGGTTWNLTDIAYSMAVVLDGAPCNMRLAFVSATGAVSEWRCTLNPGLELFRFTTNDLVHLRGELDMTKISLIVFGGSAFQRRIVAQLCEVTVEPA